MIARFELSNLKLQFPRRWAKFFSECREYLEDYAPFDGKNLFVSGGFFARRAINQPIRDIDIYVNGDEKYLECLKEEYLRLDWTVKETVGYKSPSKNIHYVCSKKDETFELDLISFHEPKSVEHISSFDFNICQIAMDEDYLYFGAGTNATLLCLEKQEMLFTGVLGSKTFQRAIKYTKLGFALSEEDQASIANMHKNG